MLIRNIKVTCNGYYRILLKRSGAFRPMHKWLKQTQFMDSKQLQEIQLQQLQELVEHAYKTVPYYTRIMKENDIRPEDIRSLDDIKRFPLLTRTDCRQAGETLVSTKYSRRFMRTLHTGGTTGTPLPLWRNLSAVQREHAFVCRQFEWAGVGLREKVAYLTWRRIAAPNEEPRKPWVYDAGQKQLHLSTIHLSEKRVPEYAEAIRKFNVKVLNAYPSAAYLLAKGCQSQKIELPLKCVLTTSEALDVAMRKLIEQVFQCKVFDYYGSAERVCYIHTCEKGSYHILPEYGITELIPAPAPNEDCFRLIATGFWNKPMPLIRYDSGDLVVPKSGTCSCGRLFPMVERIVGRDGNYIVTPSGRALGASAIEYLLSRVLYGLYEIPIYEGRVIQEAPDLIVLEYIPMQNFGQRDEQNLLQLLREEIPEEMRTDIRKTEVMNRTISGKYVSFVRNEHH